MTKSHEYQVTVEWTGNLGDGTKRYDSYDRDFVLQAENKSDIVGSSDPSFRGDATLWNPEDLLVGSLSACHKLWYLGLCSVNHITVLAYRVVVN